MNIIIDKNKTKRNPKNKRIDNITKHPVVVVIIAMNPIIIINHRKIIHANSIAPKYPKN